MKKLIALILCAALALSCAAALAEAAPEKEDIVTINMNGAFALKGLLPEGYKWALDPNSTSEQMLGAFSTDDLTRPILQLSIALDDTYGDVERLNDLSDEELQILEDTYRYDSTVEISYTETAHGTKLMVVREVGTDRDYVAFFTIYKGHMIDLVLVPGMEAEDPTITQEQVDTCVKLLSDLDFVPVEAPAA
jgi:opacity protein-like surface antigen